MPNTNFIRPAERIAHFKPYFFATLQRKFDELKAKNVDVIRLDMGSPDMPPVDFIIDTLVNSARRPDVHGYTPNGGTPEFRRAVCVYYKRRFDVDLSMSEVLGLIGSKEGLFNLSQVLLNPGDYALIPDPGYPVYTSGGLIAGAKPYYMPLLKENKFLPDLDSIPKEIAAKAKILWLNYPNNPTGAVATLGFFEKAIEFAKKYQIVIANDNPYADVCFDGYQAPSILQVPEAKEVAVEFNSLSKTYNMGGWRLAMAAGNDLVISYLHTYKSQMDSSQFRPIFDAGITALMGDQNWIEERNQIYQHRRDTVVNGLRQAGFEVETPPASIYVWARLPEGFDDCVGFCEQLLEETGVSTTPGVVYGENGKGYIRISLVTPTDRVKEAMQRTINFVRKRKNKGL